MKRVSLRRKSPLTRRTLRNVNAPKKQLAKVSDRRAKLKAIWEGKEILVTTWRRKYLADHPWCAGPGCKRRATLLHKIARGPAREKSLCEPAALLPLCDSCHREIHHVGLSIAAQLAIKQLAQPDEFDRERVNQLRGRAVDAVSEQEVLEAAKELT